MLLFVYWRFSTKSGRIEDGLSLGELKIHTKISNYDPFLRVLNCQLSSASLKNRYAKSIWEKRIRYRYEFFWTYLSLKGMYVFTGSKRLSWKCNILHRIVRSWRYYVLRISFEVSGIIFRTSRFRYVLLRDLRWRTRSGDGWTGTILSAWFT